MNKKLIALLVGSALGLVGCGGSSNGDTGGDDDQLVNATFQDIGVPVFGVNYKCDTNDSGITDQKGQFEVQDGAVCNFDLDGFAIGKNTLAISEDNATISGLDLSLESTRVMQRSLTQLDSEAALKFAANLSALLQTVSFTSEDYLDVTHVAGDSIEEEILFVESDEEFDELIRKVEIIVDEERITVEDALEDETIDIEITTPSDAEEDLEEEIQGNYESDAVKRVLAQLERIFAGDTTQIDVQDELNTMRDDLRTADGSNGRHQDALMAIIEIAEVMNEDEVAKRITVTGSEYTEMLAMLLDKNVAVDMITTPQGTTDDIADLLHESALRLINASEKLALAVPSAAYEVDYDGASLSYAQSLEIRTGALAAANVISTIASYDTASDEYYLPQREKISGVEVVVYDWATGEKELETQDFDVEYIDLDIDEAAFFNDPKLFTHRDNKYLETAKEALSAAVVTSLLLDLDDEALEILQSVDKHLSDESSVFTHTEDGETLYVNLHALYDSSKSVDRNDLEIFANNGCYQDDYNEKLSKVAGDTVCAIDNWNSVDDLIPVGREGSKTTYIKAHYSYLELDVQEAPNSNLTNVLWCGEEDGNRISCLDD
ncbi:hypothetical protein ACPV50_12300 [Vibrio astriarenae]